MIEWVRNQLWRKRFVIRLREPAHFRLVTGASRESIEATFDAGGRIVELIVHTRSRSLRTP
jgi:hypothetical protein